MNSNRKYLNGNVIKIMKIPSNSIRHNAEKWKAHISKESVKNADLYEPLLNKIITTYIRWVTYNFVALLTININLSKQIIKTLIKCWTISKWSWWWKQAFQTTAYRDWKTATIGVTSHDVINFRWCKHKCNILLNVC